MSIKRLWMFPRYSSALLNFTALWALLGAAMAWYLHTHDECQYTHRLSVRCTLDSLLQVQSESDLQADFPRVPLLALIWNYLSPSRLAALFMWWRQTFGKSPKPKATAINAKLLCHENVVIVAGKLLPACCLCGNHFFPVFHGADWNI